jgi:bis(5'-nucleosyl)-tetraphosphatase (symmetrical)
MNRVIIYGDIHGCLDEFKLHRQKLEIQKHDIEVSVGDILKKGPHLAHDMICYVREHNIKVVMGNNEVKALKQYKQYQKNGEIFLHKLRDFEVNTVLSLTTEDYRFLGSLDYFKKIYNLTILHGGVVPDMNLNSLDNKQKKEMTLIRYLDKNLKPIPWYDEKNRYKFWADLYDGRDGFMICGHHPFDEPKVYEHALDIDTGCVYGRKLTAAVFNVVDEFVDTKDVKFVFEESKRDYWNDYLNSIEKD